DAQIVVHRNGIRKPAPSFRKVPSSIVRFAYIGGVELVKGFHLVRAAFESTRSADYELKIVDNKLNLGLRSINVRNWRVAGKLIVVPAYTQDTLDDFFSQVDVLLFPSQWRESFGLAIVEALARDVWVVASDGIGAAEYIRDAKTARSSEWTTIMSNSRERSMTSSGVATSFHYFTTSSKPISKPMPSKQTS